MTNIDQASDCIWDMDPSFGSLEMEDIVPVVTSSYPVIPHRNHEGFFQKPFEDKSLEPRPINESKCATLRPSFLVPAALTHTIENDNSPTISSCIDLALARDEGADNTLSWRDPFDDLWTAPAARNDTTTDRVDPHDDVPPGPSKCVSLLQEVSNPFPFNNQWKASPSSMIMDNESKSDEQLHQRGYSADEWGSSVSQNHEVLWLDQFQNLLKFKARFGHCCVPITFAEDQVLARWVKRQRYQYKRSEKCKISCTLTSGRIHILDSIGFVWKAHAASWEERFNELLKFKETYGHCNILSYDQNNVQLSTWAKCQRRQYKLFRSGRPSNMTVERIKVLQSVGFVWALRHAASNNKTS